MPTGKRLSASANLRIGHVVLSASDALTLDGKPVANPLAALRELLNAMAQAKGHHHEDMKRLKRIGDALLQQIDPGTDREVSLDDWL